MKNKKRPYPASNNSDILLTETLSKEEGNNFNRASYFYENKDKESTFSLVLKPLFNIVVSIFFTIAILLVFITADGKPLDYTLVGMKLPTLISLLLNIYVVLVGNGIAMYAKVNS
jgi:hypothetical protein